MKISALVAPVSLSILIAASTVGCSSKEEREAKYLARAQEFIAQGDIVKARLEIRNVLQMNSENAQALYLRGLTYEKEQELPKMLQAFEASFSADPTFVPPQLKLIEYLFRYGAATDARTREIIDNILTVEPENIEALVYLSKLLSRSDNTKEAKRYAEQAAVIDPRSPLPVLALADIHKDNPEKALDIVTDGMSRIPDSPKLLLAQIQLLDELGEADRAIEAYEELVASHPNNLEYFHGLITLLDNKGRQAKAEETLRARVAENPDNASYKYWLTQHLLSTGKPQEAIELAESYVAEGTSDPRLYYLLSDIHLSLNDPVAAQRPLERLLANIGGSSVEAQKARNHIAELALRAGDITTAQKHLDAALKLDAEDADALINSAKIALMQEDIESAIIDLRTALKREPESAQAALLLARAHEANQSTDLALDNYILALKLEPTNVELAMKIASIYYGRGDNEIANRLLQNYLADEATARVVAPVLVAAFSDKEEWSQALEVAEQLENQPGNVTQGLYFRGGILFSQKEYKESIKVFEQILEKEPGSAATLTALTKAIVADTGADDAESYILEYSKKHPGLTPPLIILASLYADAGEADKARAAYEKALAVAPNDLNIHISLFNFEQRNNNFTGALRRIDKALSIAGDNSSLMILKAGLLEANGDHAGAAGIYESILELESDNTVAANNLAMILVDYQPTPEGIKRALDITQQFDKASQAVLIDTRGWVLYKAEQYEKAVTLLERAVNSSDQVVPVYSFHLGMAYYKLGDEDRAREQFSAALEDGGDFPGREQAQKILDSL